MLQPICQLACVSRVCLQLAEEQERDKEAAQIAAERYRREREMQRKEAEEALQRKKQAFLK
jgi:hypothetical protein